MPTDPIQRNTPKPRSATSTYEKFGPYYCTLQFAKYSRPKPFDKSKFITEKTYILPLPLQLFDNTTVGYNNESLETVGDILNGNLLSGAASLALRDGAKIGIRALNNSKFMPNGIAGDISNEVLNPRNITSALQQSMGAAPNPNQALAFQGPRLREFSFSWTFFPESERESTNIANFITDCKKRMLPRSVFGSDTGIMAYPNMLLMNFYPWDDGAPDGNNPYGWTKNSIIKMKRCVIDRFAVNYAPNNVPAFFQGGKGAPIAIQIEMSLLEMEYMMAEDYMGGVDSAESRAARANQANGVITGITGGISDIVGSAGKLAGGVISEFTSNGLSVEDSPNAPEEGANPVSEAYGQPTGGN